MNRTTSGQLNVSEIVNYSPAKLISSGFDCLGDSFLPVHDASGSYGGGMLAGHHQYRLVDRSLCDGLNKETEEFYSDIQKKVQNVSQIVPYPVQTVVVKYRATVLEKEREVKFSFNFINL